MLTPYWTWFLSTNENDMRLHDSDSINKVYKAADVEVLERELADERWMHAACLTIAETGQKWGDKVQPSLAMQSVYSLKCEHTSAKQQVARLRAGLVYIRETPMSSHQRRDYINVLLAEGRDRAGMMLRLAHIKVASKRSIVLRVVVMAHE